MQRHENIDEYFMVRCGILISFSIENLKSEV